MGPVLNPSKSERKSRRSSILKPPKPRQLVQNAESNVSSVESSPATTTTKVKRRVSFAEKKLVKEFCDTMEPGTMWDHTYEETEFSHMKNSQSSSNDENAIPDECANRLLKNVTKMVDKSTSETVITNPSTALERSRVSIVTESSVSVTRSATTENREVAVDGYFSTLESECNLEDPVAGPGRPRPSGIPFPAKYTESFNARRALAVIDDAFGKSASKGRPLPPEGADARPAEASAAIVGSGFRNSARFDPPPMLDDDCNEIPMDETLIGDVAVDPVVPTSLSVSQDLPLLKKSFNVVPNIDFSQSYKFPIHLPVRRASRKLEVCAGDDDKENRRDAMDQAQDDDGQMMGSKERGRVPVYHDTSMELTEAVPIRMSLTSKHQASKLGDEESEEAWSLVTERTTDFQIKTAETVSKILGLSGSSFGELDRREIDLRPDRRPTFRKASTESGGVVTNALSTEQLQKLPLERATILRDKSGDFAAVAQSERSAKKPRETAPEGTTIFHDESVNRTEAVRTASSTEKSMYTSRKSTSLFPDKSLDFSVLVRDSSSYGNLEKPPPETATIFHNQSVDVTEAVPSRPNCEKQPPEKTMIFDNQSVDMTEVVQSSLRCESTRKPLREETSIFHNQSMDMTVVVPSRVISEKKSPGKTTIFQDQSVDMTEAVSSPTICEKQPPEKTTVFHNQSVDMTEVVPSRPICEKLLPERTTIFHNHSMDMTEVIRSSLHCENPPKPPPERTTIFHDQSVDMTEAVPSRPICEKQPPEKTTIFHNQSVDMTEVVRSSLRCEKPPPEKTTIFHNQSVDMTAVVRSSLPCENPRKPRPERTTVFHDQSVDMTEAVPSRPICEKQPPEKTTISHNQSVDMTEVVPSRSTCGKQPPERTTIFHNQSVDMTEIVRSSLHCKNSRKLPPERTTIFHDQSVDMTEAVPNHPICEKQPPEKTTIFHNQSVDMTEVVPGPSSCEKQPPEKPTTFQGKPMDTTEIIPIGLSLPNPISHDTSSLNVINVGCANESAKSENQVLELTEPVRQVPNVLLVNSSDSPAPNAVEQMAKQKAPIMEKTKRLVVDINVIEHRPDPDVRSPAPKRMRSLGSRKSIDVTAAIPFVDYRKHIRQSDPDSSASCTQPSADDMSSRTSPQKTQERPRNRFTITPQKFTDYADDDVYQQPQDVTLYQDESMEITRPITGLIKAGPTIFHDNSMELTKAVKPTTKTNETAAENLSRDSNSRYEASPASENEASGGHLTSQPTTANRTVIRAGGNASSNAIAAEAKDAETMVYHDDSMELTKAVSFPSQALAEPPNEQNRPLGVSENEWLEMMNSVHFLSSEKKDNQVQLNESVEQSDANGSKETSRNFESDDITGVVPFATNINAEDGKEGQMETVGSAMCFESKNMEITDAVRWSSGPNVGEPDAVGDDEGRRTQLPITEVRSAVEKTQQRQSHVAKELFQKPTHNEKDKTSVKSATASSDTADLDAEIRKLAASFALANSVNESGFDEATFLKQQARCMEDYEANSTASQEYHSKVSSARKNASLADRSGSPKDSVGNEKPTLSTANRNSSPANTNTSVRDSSNSIAKSNFFSAVDREHYDKSLEELRCRAYSVGNFRAEITGYELTAAISMTDDLKGRESIFAVEPPSFVFADSLTTSSIVDRVATPNDLPTESRSPDGGENVQIRKSPDTSIASVHDITETTKHLRNDKPEVEEVKDVAEVTMNFENEASKTASHFATENNTERPERRHRSQTFVIKRPNHGATILIPSSPEIDKETKNDRLPGVTTAAEFTSESPDGPNEKIRRRESGLSGEVAPLPTVDKEEIAMELIEIGNAWANRHFANSTVIGDDFTRDFVPPDIEETAIVLEAPSTDDLTPEVVEVHEAHEIATEMETSLPKSPFAVLKETVEMLAKRRETIWHINRLDEKILAFNFFSKSIVLAVYLNDNANSLNPIKVIGFMSQLVEEGTDSGLRLVHRLIMEKVNSAGLTRSYRTLEQVPQLLEHVTTEVKLGMDFLFDLDRLRDRTVMEIQGNRITFTVRTRDVHAGIILSITMEVKPFEDISPDDITVAYLLGREKVRESEIKRLITNVKRDHRFLRFYINDVTDYLDLMAIAAAPNLS